MKGSKPPLPSEDKSWKIVDAKMRRLDYKGHALIKTLNEVRIVRLPDADALAA
jgi:bidirectional [NiFe] hydrogenase diaphorase subunit